jgi:dynein heavy chain
MEDFNLETAKRVSGNVAGLCSWAMAMAYFYGINKEVLPLKANLAVQESRLSQANANYNDAQAQLAAKMAEVAVCFCFIIIFELISYILFIYLCISGCTS